MTMREQVALVIFGGIPVVLGFLWVVDYVAEHIDNALSRRATWREIEVRSSRERHPSFQASLYDWEDEPVHNFVTQDEMDSILKYQEEISRSRVSL